jgi:hypothetical protein
MINIGKTYTFREMTFIVVATSVYRIDDDPRYHKPGLLLLILDGAHDRAPWDHPPKVAGDTFTVADSSAIACDSILLVLP